MSTLTPISYFIKIISFILLNGKAKEIVHSFKKFFFTSTMSHKFVYSHWITKADKRVFYNLLGFNLVNQAFNFDSDVIQNRLKKILQGIAYLNIILDLFSRNLMCEINFIALQKIFCKRITTSRSFFFQKKLFTVDVNETQNFLCSFTWNDCKLYMSKIFGLQMDNCKM